MLETKILIERNYIGKTNLNEMIYILLLNLVMEYLLNNQNYDYNKIANRNVLLGG